jgi:hypothetical protein
MDMVGKGDGMSGIGQIASLNAFSHPGKQRIGNKGYCRYDGSLSCDLFQYSKNS